jgi:glycosyltransferase involved in cell wall biosynthesis
MRILIVTQYFWPENFPINDFSSGLQDKGHDLEVLTGIPNYPSGRIFQGYSAFGPTKDTFNKIMIHRVPLVTRGNGGSIRLALNFMSFAIMASILSPFYCRNRFDIIFVYEPSPITVALPSIAIKWFKSAPMVIWMQDLWPESLSATGAIRSKAVLKIVELLVRLIYKGCDRILAQSKAFIPSIVRLGGDPDRICYYPNSADSLYQPTSLHADAAERSLVPDGFRVVFAGNIGAAQDFNCILSAAEKLKPKKDIHWLILGDGRMSNWVQAEIYKRGLSDTVHLLGRYPAEAMPRFFALSDALLVTLKKEPIFALTIPSKIQSYLACAKPIIAALDGEGARVVKEAGAGITCPAEDSKALSQAVLKLYEMTPEKRVEMGTRGRRYFESNFEREKLLDHLVKLMMELTKGKK